jgi:hypothetical protein
MALPAHSGPCPVTSSVIIFFSQTVGLLGRLISSSQGLYLNTYTYQTSMHCMGFEPTIPASERAKTVKCLIIIFFVISGVGLSPLGTAATSGQLYKPQMIDDGDCGAIGGMKIGRGNRSTRKKPALGPLCPPQIPHDQTRARTWAAAVGSQRLTA